MRPGIYRGIPNEAYHTGPGISKSGLDLVHRSPAHYEAVKNMPRDEVRESTPAQAFGTAFHAIVLEPELFAKTYCLGLRPSDVPEAIRDTDTLVVMIQELNSKRRPKLAVGGDKATLVARIIDELHGGLATDEVSIQLASMKASDLKALIEKENESREGMLSVSGTRHEMAALLRANGKDVVLWVDVLAEWVANNPGRIILTEEQWEHLHGMRAAVFAHPAASALLLADGEAELSCYAVCPITGVLLRTRPDWLRKDGIVADLKSTEDAGPEEFARSIANWRYHVQDPMYCDVIGEAIRQSGNTEFTSPKHFVFIAVEKKPPYAVGVYKLREEDVELGRAEYRNDLNDYADCLQSDHFPAYSPRIENIALPAWYYNKNAAALALSANQ